jgi:4-aminobutyrate aminotransferase-like enzyme
VAFARRHGLVVAFDEMQSGFGRTGEFFGYSHYGVEPDLLCCGKGSRGPWSHSDAA